MVLYPQQYDFLKLISFGGGGGVKGKKANSSSWNMWQCQGTILLVLGYITDERKPVCLSLTCTRVKTVAERKGCLSQASLKTQCTSMTRKFMPSATRHV